MSSEGETTATMWLESPKALSKGRVQIRRLLLELGLKNRLYYKPDMMTHAGMYRITGSRINHRYFG